MDARRIVKAEEKFPRLRFMLAANQKVWPRNEEQKEVSELLEFWDAHQWQPIETAPKDGAFLVFLNGAVKSAFLIKNPPSGAQVILLP